MRYVVATACCFAMATTANAARPDQEPPVAWWPFDEIRSGATRETVGKIEDPVAGRANCVPGVVGGALECDGFTSRVVREAKRAPGLDRAFTAEAWVAVQAYPWGWCPIVSQREAHRRGYFFGIDAEGHVGLHLAVDGTWQACTSEKRLPLLQWAHVAGTFDPAEGIRLYVNGEPAGTLDLQGKMTPAPEVDLLIGANHQKEPAMFETVSMPVHFSFDGIVDEVKIHGRAVSVGEIQKAYETVRPAGPPPLSLARLPSGPECPNRFGAFYVPLKYREAWDAVWRGTGPDVVVTFDKAPFRFVSWKGISYAPCWVTEKGNWFTNEFMERGVDRGKRGCTESMSDKRARFSHVKILEQSDARAVVYWRHSPVDVFYEPPYVDEVTGWGDWCEEYHTIYPDGVAVRKVVMFSSNFEAWHEWCQSLEILHPGQRPEDVLDGERIMAVANMEGESETYGWSPGEKSYRHPALAAANVQITYLKSRFNPFLILDDRPGKNDAGGDGPAITRVGGDGWSRYSRFPWRNHWPVTQPPLIGRYAVAADRPAHTYTATQYSAAYAATDHSMTKIMLCGMTDRESPLDLLPLARSWLRPPELEVVSGPFESRRYDPTERAYVVARTAKEAAASLECTIHAGQERPLVNLALVVMDWGDLPVGLHVDGRAVLRGEAFRVGYRRRLDGTDLVVWVEREATRNVRVELTPGGTP